MTSSSKLKEAETETREPETEPGPEEEYYIQVFNRLEKESKHTWNWAAFFFSTAWMRYRKMFVAAVLCGIASFLLKLSVVVGILFIPEQLDLLQACVLILLTQIFCSILYGYFGNYLYYLHAKSLISMGFHLVDKYRCTSVLAIFGGWWSVPAFWLADFLAHKEHFSKNKLTDNEFVEKNVKKFLRCTHKNHKYGRVAELVACICFVGILYSAITIHEPQTQVTERSSYSETSFKTENDSRQSSTAETTRSLPENIAPKNKMIEAKLSSISSWKEKMREKAKSQTSPVCVNSKLDSLMKKDKIMQIRKSNSPVKEYLKMLLPNSLGEVFRRLY